MNRISKMALAGMGLLSCFPTVKADFVVSNTVTTSNGFDDFIVKALNNGANGTGTKLLAADIFISTPGTTTATALQINFADIDNDGAADADISGSNNLAFGSTANGTFMRIGQSSSFSVTSATPAHFQTDPNGVGTATQAVDPAYSNLHSLEIAGYNLSGGAGASTGSGANLVNIVVPHGTPVTLTGELIGDMGPKSPFGFGTIPQPAPIISLTTAAPPAGSFGNSLGTLTVTGGNGSYTLAQITGLNSTSGFIDAKTFVPASDSEIYGLDVLVGGTQATPTQIALLVADINAAAGQTGAVGVASAVSPAIGAFPSAYNLFVDYTGLTSGDNFFGFNLGNDAFVPNATVSAIAVVPEPASAAGLILAAFGFLGTRRPKNS